MFYDIREFLDGLDIVHLDNVNPSTDEVFKALDTDSVDAVSYYITTDIVKQQCLDFVMSYKKYDIEMEKYVASQYSECGRIYNEPVNKYLNNPPGMSMYDIITELPMNATFLCEGKELSKEMFQNVEYIPNFLLSTSIFNSCDNRIEIENTENEYIKVYTLKYEYISGQRKNPYLEGNIVILNKKMFKVH
jgi:hypothetical protein